MGERVVFITRYALGSISAKLGRGANLSCSSTRALGHSKLARSKLVRSSSARSKTTCSGASCDGTSHNAYGACSTIRKDRSSSARSRRQVHSSSARSSSARSRRRGHSSWVRSSLAHSSSARSSWVRNTNHKRTHGDGQACGPAIRTLERHDCWKQGRRRPPSNPAGSNGFSWEGSLDLATSTQGEQCCHSQLWD